MLSVADKEEAPELDSLGPDGIGVEEAGVTVDWIETVAEVVAEDTDVLSRCGAEMELNETL